MNYSSNVILIVSEKNEHIEPYGFTSDPFTDGKTDAVTIFFDPKHNHSAIINTADIRYSITSMK